MNYKSNLEHAFSLAAIVTVMALQTGCDQDIASRIASAILPANAHAVTASVNRKIADARFKEAQDEGIAFLKEHEDKSGQLAWALARVSAKLGNHGLAIKFAGEAVRRGAVSAVQLMAEPMLEPVRTDSRFTSLAAGIRSAGAAVTQAEPAGVGGSVAFGFEGSGGGTPVLPD